MSSIANMTKRPAMSEWIAGVRRDGTPLDIVASNKYRAIAGLPPIGNATTTPAVHENQLQSPTIRQPAKPRYRQLGPGSHLKAMLASLGLQACMPCNGRSQQMDQWGVDGCRKNRATIIGWLNESAHATTWKKWISAGAIAVWKGMPTSPDGLLDEAIRRAESNDATTRTNS